MPPKKNNELVPLTDTQNKTFFKTFITQAKALADKNNVPFNDSSKEHSMKSTLFLVSILWGQKQLKPLLNLSRSQGYAFAKTDEDKITIAHTTPVPLAITEKKEKESDDDDDHGMEADDEGDVEAYNNQLVLRNQKRELKVRARERDDTGPKPAGEDRLVRRSKQQRTETKESDSDDDKKQLRIKDKKT